MSSLPPIQALAVAASFFSDILSFPLAHFSSNRRGVAANEGHHGAPVMDSSYLLDDPAGPMDLDDSPCRGYTAASPERDERLSEVRGCGAPVRGRSLLLLCTLVHIHGPTVCTYMDLQCVHTYVHMYAHKCPGLCQSSCARPIGSLCQSESAPTLTQRQ